MHIDITKLTGEKSWYEAESAAKTCQIDMLHKMTELYRNQPAQW